MVDLSGFGGKGYIDPTTGQWVSTEETPGTTLFGTPEGPNSGFATPQGGPLTTRGAYGPSPSSSTGAPATAVSTPNQTVMGPQGPVTNRTPAATPPSSQGWQNPFNKPYVGPNGQPQYVDDLTAKSGGATGLANDAVNALKARYGFAGGPGNILRTLGFAVPELNQQTVPQTQTQTQPVGAGPATPIPPQQFGGANPNFPPNSPLPPINRPPPFPPQPQFHGAPAAQARPGSMGGPQASVAQAPQAPSNINLGFYRPSIGNARTPSWVPGGAQQGWSQMWRGPQTMQGAPNVPGSPSGAQNYYQPGSAPMGPGDWTGTGAPAGPGFPQPGNFNPGQGANARGGGQASPQSAAPPQPPGFQVSPPGAAAIQQGLDYTGQGFDSSGGGGRAGAAAQQAALNSSLPGWQNPRNPNAPFGTFYGP